uniref:Uncharacterized protein n=1 Tax=Streptomyces sp. F11 TaxID=319318 RepID=Q58IR0_9ACTN|nr:hypothetical protein [Streptomyces sp. F11]AAX51323.1 unknown [Streptomyces sp. F11]
MGVKYVLTEPAPPGWWAKNKVIVCSVACLLIGFYIGGGNDGQAEPANTPTPSITPTCPSKG